MLEMKLAELPKSRPEIWRLAIYLNAMFSNGGWAAADKIGWYKTALKIHNEVFRNMSPHLAHEIPIEAQVIAFNNEQE